MTVKHSDPAADITLDSRWKRVVNRDRTASSEFVYCVTTTGVYCRPSCPARLPNPRNVEFYRTPEQAEKAGYRPCERCRPNQPEQSEQHATIIAAACNWIEDSASPVTLADLAARAGMSRFHFHRVFKAATGVTPKQYAAATRSKRVRESLRKSASITDAIYEAGFNSNGRFYATSNQLLGMPPSRFRKGGDATEIQFAIGQCSLGALLVGFTERGVCAILLGDNELELERNLAEEFPHSQLRPASKDFQDLLAQVAAFVEAPGADFGLPLDVRGTAFQQRVWDALRRIPAGSTSSYSSVAEAIGSPAAVRAVAAACAANRLAVAVPCHRVVKSDGALAGYRWGVERKRALLEKERKARTEPVLAAPEITNR